MLARLLLLVYPLLLHAQLPALQSAAPSSAQALAEVPKANFRKAAPGIANRTSPGHPLRKLHAETGEFHGKTLAEGGEGEAEEKSGEEAEATEGEAEGKEEGKEEEAEEGGEEYAEEEMEKEEEEEESASPVDVHVACMLLGSVSLVMLLFTIVNNKDDDIRRYSWRVISDVISIFVAVLMFLTLNEWVVINFEHSSIKVLCCVQYGQLFVYICVLQFVIAYTSGTICEGKTHNLNDQHWCYDDAMRQDYEQCVWDESRVRNKTGRKSVIKVHDKTRWKEVYCQYRAMNMEKRKRKMKCWATLGAHMAGFAAISAGGHMQQLEMFRSNPLMSLIPIVFNQLYVLGLFWVFNLLREGEKAKALAEGRQALRAKLFDEEVEEAENDISGLSISFLLVQVIRYAVGGTLPHVTGLDNPDINHPIQYNVIIFGFAFCFLISLIVFAIAKSKVQDEGFMFRFLTILQGAAGMSMAWSILWGTRAAFMDIDPLNKMHEGVKTMMGRILMSLTLTLVSLCVIFPLDTIDDSFSGSDDDIGPGKDIVSALINAIAVLVGFSWEHSFDGGVEAIASLTPENPLTTETALVAFVFVAVIPPWQSHILRKAMQLQTYKEEGKKKEESSELTDRRLNSSDK